MEVITDPVDSRIKHCECPHTYKWDSNYGNYMIADSADKLPFVSNYRLE